MQQLINEIKRLNTTQWLFIAGMVVLLLIILFLIIRNMRRRRLAKKVDELEVTLTSFTSLPIEFRLNRAQSLAASNKEFALAFERYSNDFEQLKEFYDNEIREPMSELDDAIFYKKNKKAKGLIRDMHVVIEDYGKRAQLLLSALEEASEVESIQRVEIIRIKEKYRVLKQVFDQNKSRLSQVEYSMEDYFRNLDRQFAEFEQNMSDNQFDQSRIIAEEIEHHIDYLDQAIIELPDLIVKTRQIIPKRVDELVSQYHRLKEEGYWLVPYDVFKNVESINEQFKRILKDINNLQIMHASQDIDRIHQRLDEIMEQLKLEEQVKPEYDEVKEPLFNRVDTLLSDYEDCYRDYYEIKDYYYIPEELNRIVNFQAAAKAIAAKKDFLDQLIQSGKFSYVSMNEDLKELQNSILVLELQVQNYRFKSDELRIDERRIREEVRNLRVILIEIKSQIRTHHLPIIDESYKNYIESGYHAIQHVEELLKKRPLPLDDLNLRIDDARDLIYKLYENVHNLIVTAEMVENAIVFGNRYRSLSAEVETELTRAELFFRNGEYTTALSIAIEVMEKIQPGSYERLLSIKEKK